MPDFVLVHGAAHGAWCWEPLLPHLEPGARPGRVLAVDLPGRGARASDRPLEEISFDDYVSAVVEDIEAADLHDVVLVGHSLAGITIPRVAERIPQRIARLVYLASAHPAEGQTVMQMMQHPLSPISRGISADLMFCNDLDDEATAWLLGRIGPEPPAPMHEPVRPGRTTLAQPPVYILCEHDEAMPPALQREQARNAGAEVVVFDAGHSAFASKPRELAELLLGLAA